jgi:hypothetical protein
MLRDLDSAGKKRPGKQSRKRKEPKGEEQRKECS